MTKAAERSFKSPMQDAHTSFIDSLYRISSLDGNTDDPQEALSLIVEEVVEQLGCSSASIALINPDTGRLQIEAQYGLPDEFRHLELPLTHGVTGWVALHGSPLTISDVSCDPRYFRVRENVCSEMAVPMETRGSIIGVVNVDSDRVNAFDEEDLKMLTLMTHEATRVVNRLWLIRQLRTKAQHLESLVKTGQTLVSQRDVRKILKHILREARRIMNCPLCALYLLTEDRQRIRLAAVSGLGEEIDYDEELELGQTSVGVAILRRKQVEVTNLPRTEEHHFIPIIQREKLVSLLSTPIIYGDEIIGVLNAYTDRSHRFNDDEKTLFAALASLGAVAIQNARLYSRVFASEENLRKNEKLTTLGLLAAEIAHEIRNPLTVIKLLFESLELDYTHEDPRSEDLRVIGEKLLQLEEIVERVLSFGRSNQALYSRWRVHHLIEETLLLVRLKLEQCKISLSYEPPTQQLHIEANKGQMLQAILNIIINAVEAMPEGGTISLRAYADERMGESIARIRICDTGGGIPASMREQIFESFLSSKTEGTGLGLGIVKRIMRSHRGDIDLISSSGTGTCFELWLPLTQK